MVTINETEIKKDLFKSKTMAVFSHSISENIEHTKKRREELIQKWIDSGLLDNLKAPGKKNIAELYECCASKIYKDKK
jgi:hypothetical protein